jgi:hypothetical protein
MGAQLEGTQIDERTYAVTARPEHGAPVTLYVGVNYTTRAAFAVKRGLDRSSYITTHRTFEDAVRSANLRAKRYLAAYSKPHGLAAARTAAS